MEFSVSLLGSVTIWYNPDPSFVEHVTTYSNMVHQLVIVDNSLTDNRELFDRIDKKNKIYLRNSENLGIAAALNQGIKLLQNNGYKFALTLD